MQINLNADLGEGFGPWTMGDDLAMLNMIREAYADRTYDDGLNLTGRSVPGAVIGSVETALDRVMTMLDQGCLTSVSGKRLTVTIQSICVHGDNPSAVAMARALRTGLETAGWTVAPARG